MIMTICSIVSIRIYFRKGIYAETRDSIQYLVKKLCAIIKKKKYEKCINDKGPK